MASFLKVIDQGLRTAVYAKFKDDLGINSVTNDTGIFPKDLALRKVSEKRGDVSMEFISVWRNGTAPDMSRQRSPLARQGLYLNYTSQVTKTDIATVYAVPAALQYDVWFWSKDKEKLNVITEKYLFWMHNTPNLTINYNDTYPLEYYLKFGEVIDESPLDAVYDRGTYFVIKCPISLEGWVLTGADNTKTIKKIVVSVYDEGVDANTLLYTETITFTP